MLTARQQERHWTGQFRRLVHSVDLEFHRRPAEDRNGAGGRLVGEFKRLGVYDPRGLQVAIQAQQSRTGGPRAGSTACGPAGSQRVSSSCAGQSCPSTMAPPFHGMPTPPAESTTVFGPIRSKRETDSRGRGQQLQIRRQQGILEVQRHPRKAAPPRGAPTGTARCRSAAWWDRRSGSAPRCSGRWRAYPGAPSGPGSARRSLDSVRDRGATPSPDPRSGT